MWFNHDVEPYNDKNVRWAVSYSINREQMLDVALEGSGILTELPFPYYESLMPYIEAAAPLLEKYPTNEFNLDKAAEHMQLAGYEKDSDGFWVKNGERIQADIGGWTVFADIGPVIAEQLRRGGFEAQFSTPVITVRASATASPRSGSTATVVASPIRTPRSDSTPAGKYYAPIGEPTSQSSRYNNPEYDAVPRRDGRSDARCRMTRLTLDLYLKAMEIWLDDLVDARIQQWLHRIPMNTTYWTNWPTAENPYVNGGVWHLTFPLILHHLQPAQ